MDAGRRGLRSQSAGVTEVDPSKAKVLAITKSAAQIAPGTGPSRKPTFRLSVLSALTEVSASVSTIWGIMAWYAGSKKLLTMPNRGARATRCQNCSRWGQLSQATSMTIHRGPASAHSMRKRRETRSAITPPSNRNNILGAHCAMRMRLIAVAESVRSRTSQVMAMVNTASPSTEMVCPAHRSVNGREWNARAKCSRSTIAECKLATCLIATGSFMQVRSEEHTSELQSHLNLVCRLLLENKN